MKRPYVGAALGSCLGVIQPRHQTCKWNHIGPFRLAGFHQLNTVPSALWGAKESSIHILPVYLPHRVLWVWWNGVALSLWVFGSLAGSSRDCNTDTGEQEWNKGLSGCRRDGSESRGTPGKSPEAGEKKKIKSNRWILRCGEFVSDDLLLSILYSYTYSPYPPLGWSWSWGHLPRGRGLQRAWLLGGEYQR